MKAIVAATILLVVAACGSSQGKPAAATTPSPSGPPLIAVLQANGTANPWTYNTVAIVGLDGAVRAKATFTPMAIPKTACMGPILQPSAHVAAGKVFFADSQGVVRSLATDGTLIRITAFPMTSTQQMLSFAVSPDGTKLLGTVYTVPANAWPCDGSSSTYTFDTYAAESGKPSTLLDHQVWTKPQNALALTGWDAVGPIGTYPTVYASQGGGPSSTLGVAVRVDASTGKPGRAFAGDGCLVWDSVATGAFVCTGSDQTVSVRGADGGELWKVAASPAESALLAPDAKHVTLPGLVVGRDGVQSKLASGFFAVDWVDSGTMVGEYHPDPLAQPPLPLAYLKVDAPDKVAPLIATGRVLGPLAA